MHSQTILNIRLFVATLASAFLFIFGAGTLLLMFAPVFAAVLTPTPPYHPQLPIAGDRTQPFIDENSVAAVEPYPELDNPDSVKPGNWIYIPSIGVDIPLVMSASINDSDVLASLASGAALYPNGILPGHLGNVFIAAHSTGEPWKGKYRFAFIKINELTPGHIINLDYNGTRYTYKVTQQQLVKPSSDYQVVSDRPVPTVTLMACWPLWTTNQRMLITAELTNITKLTPTPS